MIFQIFAILFDCIRPFLVRFAMFNVMFPVRLIEFTRANWHNKGQIERITCVYSLAV